MKRTRLRIFRWRAVGPLLFFLLILGVLWIILADGVGRRLVASDLSETLGTEVDIARFRILETDPGVEISGFAVADPRNRMRNLLEAGTITVQLDPVPLTEKKFVINQLHISGVQFLTARKTAARPADPNSPAARLLSESEQWVREKFEFPKLALSRIDTVKRLVLNPEELGTVKATRALLGIIDSTRGAFEQSLAALQLKQLVDSSTALTTRLAQIDLKALGLLGIRNTVSSVRKAIDQIKEAKTRLQVVEQTAKTSLGAWRGGLQDVNAARLKDYAFARGLLELPSFAPPDISASMFGEYSLDYFQRALHYVKVIQRYVPPGLQAWNRPGLRRLRRAGTTVEFPREKEYPRFLLRQGSLTSAAGSEEPTSFKATFSGITSQPALVGLPAMLVASGRLGNTSAVSIDLSALARHFGSSPVDSLEARVSGVRLPTIPIPGLPFAVHPGTGVLHFAFSLAGDRLAGALEISASQVSWRADSTRLQAASVVERTIWRVISGLTELRVRAELSGSIASPSLSLSSNLDEAIAARLWALAGEELAQAEQRARAAVDQLVSQQVAVLEARVNEVERDVLGRLPIERGQLEAVEQLLEAQLRRLAGGLIRRPE